MGKINHGDGVWSVQNGRSAGSRYIITYSQPSFWLQALSVVVRDELFTFRSLQFVFAVEIFKWVTSSNIRFDHEGHFTPIFNTLLSYLRTAKNST